MAADRARRQLAILLDLFEVHDDAAVEHAVLEASAAWVRPVDVGGAALVAALRAAGIVDLDLDAAPWWGDLAPGARAALVLLEVEHVPAGRAALLLDAPTAAVEAAYGEACEALGWEPLGQDLPCSGWPTVARMYRTGTGDAGVAVRHLQHCVRCGRWHFDRLDRRAWLAGQVPRIGGTGLGARWDAASI